MRKIEYNKEYVSDELTTTYEYIQENNGALQILQKKVWKDESGIYDETENTLIISKDKIRGMSNNCIIMMNSANKNINKDNSEYINADKDGGFLSSKEAHEYELKIAKNNL